MKLRYIIESIIQENFEAWALDIEEHYGLHSFIAYEHSGKIYLDSIIVSKENQGKGIGTKVMNDLCRYADQFNMIIVLTPGLKNKKHGTTSQSRLIEFYKRFGFTLNKGRNKDYSISGLMYRNPDTNN